MENIAFKLILYAGNSKSSSMEALRYARACDEKIAQEKLVEAQEQLLIAHEIQTNLLFKNAQGEKQEVDILMVHAQDHLNGAIIILELVTEMIGMYEELKRGNLNENIIGL